jgi:hypothetical protein
MGCKGIVVADRPAAGRTWDKPGNLPDTVGSNLNTGDPPITVVPDSTVYASFTLSRGCQYYPVLDASFDHGAAFTQSSSLIPPGTKNWRDRDFIAVGPDGTVYATRDYGLAAGIRTGLSRVQHRHAARSRCPAAVLGGIVSRSLSKIFQGVLTLACIPPWILVEMCVPGPGRGETRRSPSSPARLTWGWPYSSPRAFRTTGVSAGQSRTAANQHDHRNTGSQGRNRYLSRRIARTAGAVQGLGRAGTHHRAWGMMRGALGEGVCVLRPLPGGRPAALSWLPTAAQAVLRPGAGNGVTVPGWAVG